MSKKIKGIGASSGISIARVFKIQEIELEIKDFKIDNPEKEINKFDSAIEEALKQISLVKKTALKNLGPEEAAVFDAHMQVANDPSMSEEIKSLIIKNKDNALFATNQISSNYAAMFENMDDPYLKERSADIRDVARRIMYILSGIKSTDVSTIDEEVIIVASDLTPSDTAQLNKKYVKGFITDIGGRTSHAAIMARSLEIPAILGLGDITSIVKDGDIIAIDGDTGEVVLNPSDDEIKLFNKKIKELDIEKEENNKFFGKKTLTHDGIEVELASNIGAPKDVDGALENDAQAIGLFRSEFLYMDANTWPTEEQQYKSYKEVLEKMKGKKVIVRTLDIGGDKKLSYFKFPDEMNPFLGYRAIRLCLDKPDIFLTQLRALLRASIHGNLGIMFPMITTIDEFLMAKEILEKAKKELLKEGIEFSNSVEVGMMVEIPSTAVIAKQFAKHADFFSIGTNDLMQYTMAADRMSEKVSHLYQPLNPAILKMIHLAIEGAHSQGKWVGMCGEMAGDESVLPLLLGLGLDEFSMSASSILKIRRMISKIKMSDAKLLAAKALEASTQDEVKELLEKFNSN